jgi:DNA-binding MarR family transcriptional regulator
VYYVSVAELLQGDAVEARERVRVSASETAWALREVNRLAADFDAELARRLGLRPLDHAALGHVMTSQTPVGPAELSARLGISTGSGTELVDRLEQAGHLQRQRDTQDRRRVLLYPSRAAVEAVLAELTPLLRALDSIEDDLSPDERQVVIRYLRIAAGHIRQHTQP